ncbi:MAG: dihydroorotase [Synechococcaceae cyanobacterium SM2_3_1]|nr:dihydroorotase [Synechococcaceae cyanobacterium SM2_3_1]
MNAATDHPLFSDPQHLSTVESLVLKQVRLLNPVTGLDQVGDLWVQQGRVKATGTLPPELPSHTCQLSGEGWVVGPGLVDLYAHGSEPGFEHRETRTELTLTAMQGGFTRVALLPSTVPALDSITGLAALQKQLPPEGPAYLPLAAVTLQAAGHQLSDLGDLSSSAIVGFCQDQPLQSYAQLRHLMEYLQGLAKPLLLWAWDPQLAQSGVLFEGSTTLHLGLAGIPTLAETTVVATLLEFLHRTPIPLHLMRISQPRSLDLIRQAQSAGLPLSASTTWLHLLFSVEAIQQSGYDPYLRLTPPLVEETARQHLIQGVRDRVLAIATDHQAYTFEEKAVPFGEAPSGAPGLALALPLLWDQLVRTGALSPLQLWAALSSLPALNLQQLPGQLSPEQPADLVVLDPEHNWTPPAHPGRSALLTLLYPDQKQRGKILGYWSSHPPSS